jgi:hypothetical protein
MDKRKALITFLVGVFLLAACQPATPPPPVSTEVGTEFTLAPGQMASITGTDLNITLISVPGDQRCPSEIECAMSGPVSISLSVQSGSAAPAEINLQTFTGNDGRAPTMQFEGIESQVTYEGYSIQVAGVLPYPKKSNTEVKDSEYRVDLVVSKE